MGVAEGRICTALRADPAERVLVSVFAAFTALLFIAKIPYGTGGRCITARPSVGIICTGLVVLLFLLIPFSFSVGAHGFNGLVLCLDFRTLVDYLCIIVPVGNLFGAGGARGI